MTARARIAGPLLAAIEADIRAGSTDSAAARAHGITRERVVTIRRRIGVAPKPRGGVSAARKAISAEIVLAIKANHAAGMTDKENAAACGISLPTVRRYRNALNLTPNGRPFGAAVLARQEETKAALTDGRAARLYSSGLSDKAIAAAVGVAPNTVMRWRHRTNREAIGVGGTPARIVSQPALRDPLWAACRQAIGYGIATDVAEDAVSDLVLDVIAGKVRDDAIPFAAKTYRNRASRYWANRYGPASLDEDRDGEGWTRYATTPDSTAEMPFRLVELIRLAELRGIDWRAVLAS